ISKVHPSRNLRLRDSTFRPPDRQVYQPKRVLPPSQFVPPVVTPIGVPKVHPARNLRLRDSTFRPPDRQVYQPKRVLPPAQFVPGGLVAIHPRSRNNWLRVTDHRYYRLKRVLPPSTQIDVAFNAVPRTHPSRNPILRRRELERQYYQPKRTLYTHIFVAGIVVLVSKVHPSRNIRLRDKTFRPPHLGYYQPNRASAFTLAIVSTGLTEVLFKGMWHGMYKRMR
ncbi:MAG: hypothetical protein ACYTFW_06570, partial [Planctomycetota bacterium]